MLILLSQTLTSSPTPVAKYIKTEKALSYRFGATASPMVHPRYVQTNVDRHTVLNIHNYWCVGIFEEWQD